MGSLRAPSFTLGSRKVASVVCLCGLISVSFLCNVAMAESATRGVGLGGGSPKVNVRDVPALKDLLRLDGPGGAMLETFLAAFEDKALDVSKAVARIAEARNKTAGGGDALHVVLRSAESHVNEVDFSQVQGGFDRFSAIASGLQKMFEDDMSEEDQIRAPESAYDYHGRGRASHANGGLGHFNHGPAAVAGGLGAGLGSALGGNLGSMLAGNLGNSIGSGLGGSIGGGLAGGLGGLVQAGRTNAGNDRRASVSRGGGNPGHPYPRPYARQAQPPPPEEPVPFGARWRAAFPMGLSYEELPRSSSATTEMPGGHQRGGLFGGGKLNFFGRLGETEQNGGNDSDDSGKISLLQLPNQPQAPGYYLDLSRNRRVAEFLEDGLASEGGIPGLKDNGIPAFKGLRLFSGGGRPNANPPPTAPESEPANEEHSHRGSFGGFGFLGPMVGGMGAGRGESRGSRPTEGESSSLLPPLGGGLGIKAAFGANGLQGLPGLSLGQGGMFNLRASAPDNLVAPASAPLASSSKKSGRGGGWYGRLAQGGLTN